MSFDASLDRQRSVQRRNKLSGFQWSLNKRGDKSWSQSFILIDWWRSEWRSLKACAERTSVCSCASSVIVNFTLETALVVFDFSARLNQGSIEFFAYPVCPIGEIPSRADQSMCVQHSVDDGSIDHVCTNHCVVHRVRILPPCRLRYRFPRVARNEMQRETFNDRKQDKVAQMNHEYLRGYFRYVELDTSHELFHWAKPDQRSIVRILLNGKVFFFSQASLNICERIQSRSVSCESIFV